MFQPVRILIVEDEFTIALDLETRLKKWGHAVIGIANNANDTHALIANERPELILMDIHIKGEQSGIDLARSILKDSQIPFIYLTAFGDKKTFEKAKQTYPFAFITKPFKDEELKRTIDLAVLQKDKPENQPDINRLLSQLSQTTTQKAYYFAREGTKIRRINIEDILYISALDNYAKVHLTSGMLIIHEPMNRLEKKLAPYDIVRVHRSYLVAIQAIDSIEESQITVRNEELPVSKTYKKDLMEKLTWL